MEKGSEVEIRSNWNGGSSVFGLWFKVRKASQDWTCQLCHGRIVKGDLHGSRFYEHICLSCTEAKASHLWVDGKRVAA